MQYLQTADLNKGNTAFDIKYIITAINNKCLHYIRAEAMRILGFLLYH